MILRMNLIYNVQSATEVSVISVFALLLFSLFDLGIFSTILDFYDLFLLDVLYYVRFFNNISCIACYLTGLNQSVMKAKLLNRHFTEGWVLVTCLANLSIGCGSGEVLSLRTWDWEHYIHMMPPVKVRRLKHQISGTDALVTNRKSEVVGIYDLLIFWIFLLWFCVTRLKQAILRDIYFLHFLLNSF